MRASRLLSLLLLLQQRGRMTAQDLADELGVSVRTIYRDMDAMAGSGVPVSADRGPDGGYSLPPDYAARLPRPTGREAATVARLPPVAAELGLGRVLATAERVPEPADRPDDRTVLVERFDLDAPGWFREAEHVGTLTALADAVWHERAVRLRYRRWTHEETLREVEPLGMVLRSGTWFLVAAPHRAPGDPATYRVARIAGLEALDEPGGRPPGFDLGAYWAAHGPQVDATVRLSPRGRELAASVLRPPTVRALVRQEPLPDDGDGWVRATVPVASLAEARAELLALGPEVEVLAPAALREQMRAAAAGFATLYG